MNLALFGGTFDPVHKGHLAVARAAARRFRLQRIYFVPADIPPHKRERGLAPYYHRYAMLALATAGEKAFVPSLLEAAVFAGSEQRPSYSIEAVRRMKARLRPSDRLFFIIGIDAFLDIATWRQPVELLREAEFIVASRPGYSLADVGRALPEELRPDAKVLAALRRAPARGQIVLPQLTVHLLGDVKVNVSATEIRRAAAQGRSVARWVEPAVAEYIKKTHLYQEPPAAGGPRKARARH